MPQYQSHAPGQEPPDTAKDHNGVAQYSLRSTDFAAAPPQEHCPAGMFLDPATGECVAVPGKDGGQ